jgi:hypothetical protein
MLCFLDTPKNETLMLQICTRFDDIDIKSGIKRATRFGTAFGINSATTYGTDSFAKWKQIQDGRAPHTVSLPQRCRSVAFNYRDSHLA